MRRNRYWKVLFIPLGIAAMAMVGFVISGLWNALVPEIFGLHTISFWQALGLLVLSRILFGRFGGGGRGGHGRWNWKGMTPEERQRFCRGMGPGRPEADAPQEAGEAS